MGRSFGEATLLPVPQICRVMKAGTGRKKEGLCGLYDWYEGYPGGMDATKVL